MRHSQDEENVQHKMEQIRKEKFTLFFLYWLHHVRTLFIMRIFCWKIDLFPATQILLKSVKLFVSSFITRLGLQKTFEECLTEVSKRFITGSVNGQFIDSMKTIVQEITPLAFNNQFQEPKITNRISFELDIGGNGKASDGAPNEFKTNQDVKSSLDFTYETRPSDFRIKSICYGMNGGRPSVALATPPSASIVDHRTIDDDNLSAREICKYPTNEHTTETASKSIRKLFNEFIADFSTSIERYCY